MCVMTHVRGRSNGLLLMCSSCEQLNDSFGIQVLDATVITDYMYT